MERSLWCCLQELQEKQASAQNKPITDRGAADEWRRLGKQDRTIKTERY